MSQQEIFVLDCPAVAPDRRPTRLHGVVHPPKPGDAGSFPEGPRPAVLICHGFKGFMEWGFFPPLADLLAERGFVAVRFNFSSSGMLPGDELASNVEGFRRGTYSQDRAEVLRLLAALGNEIAPGLADPERVALVGHSRGGAASLQAAGHPDWSGRLKALVTWASVSTYDRFDQATQEVWRRDGEIVIPNARTGQELPFGIEVLDDLQSHRDELDLLAAAGRRQAPWLIVHGSDDETVAFGEAEKLDRAAAGVHELHRIDGANHTFGAKHPFAGPTPHLIEAMNATQTWLKRYLC